MVNDALFSSDKNFCADGERRDAGHEDVLHRV